MNELKKYFCDDIINYIIIPYLLPDEKEVKEKLNIISKEVLTKFDIPINPYCDMHYRYYATYRHKYTDKLRKIIHCKMLKHIYDGQNTYDRCKKARANIYGGEAWKNTFIYL